MARMKGRAPAQKVTFATVAVALVGVAVAFFGDGVPQLKEHQAELATIATFLAGYFVPPSANDQVNDRQSSVSTEQPA